MSPLRLRTIDHAMKPKSPDYKKITRLNQMQKPNLFILGAPKCGTTSLFFLLAQHNQVFAPKQKEPHYFYNPYGKAPTSEKYFGLYDTPGESYRYALDSSVWYLFSKTAASRILSEVESPKFIVCLRNPLELAPSLHFQKIYSGHEAIQSFTDAWALSEERYSGSFKGILELGEHADPRHMSYKHASLLGDQTATLIRNVGQENVFYCFLEDLSSNPEFVFFELCEFLDLDLPENILYQIENKAKKSRSRGVGLALNGLAKLKCNLGLNRETGLLTWAHRLNRVEVAYAKPNAELRREMSLSFVEDVLILQNLTGRNLSHWLTQ